MLPSRPLRTVPHLPDPKNGACSRLPTDTCPKSTHTAPIKPKTSPACARKNTAIMKAGALKRGRRDVPRRPGGCVTYATMGGAPSDRGVAMTWKKRKRRAPASVDLYRDKFDTRPDRKQGLTTLVSVLWLLDR